MKDTPETQEAFRLLVQRSAFLHALADSPRDKRALAEDLDISRSTVDRALRELMSAQFVTYHDHTYELTLTGKCALRVYTEFEEKIEGVIGAQQLLSMLPADASIDPLFLANAETHTSTPDIPDSVITELFESVKQSDELYGLAPVAIVGQLQAFYDAATAGGTQVEMIIDEKLFERLLQSADSRRVMVESVRRERTNIYTAAIPFGYGVWAVDDEAGIVVYTDTGVGGIAVNDSPNAIAWARSMFDAIYEDATLMTLSAIGEDPSSGS